ncbi:MAG TPA: hypothetical protein VGK67_27460 [Myxococcales bacterium]
MPSIFHRFRDLTSLESFFCAQEALGSAPEEEKEAARAALDLTASALESARSASLDAERLSFGARAQVLVQGSPIPWREVPRRLSVEPAREIRAPIARAADAALSRLDSVLSRRIEVCLRLASDLRFPTYLALRSAVSGVDLTALALEAEKTLKETEDAWRDLFEFGLRRMVGLVSLRPRGDAAEHDLVRFARLEPLDDLFRAGRLLSTAQGALEAMGLSADASGRISVDADDPGGRPAGAATLAIDVPGEIAIVLGRLGGAHDYSQLFHALGRAHFFAMVSREHSPEVRRAGDGAGSFGALFDQLLVDTAFLQRTLDADPKEAVEAARLNAIERLARLRHLCASLVYQRTLYAEGANEELRGLYRELHGKALGVDWPLERWLHDVEPRVGCAARLRAFALAEVTRRALLEEADEDWWRNPRTGAFLKRLASRGGAASAESVAKGLGGVLSLSGAAQRLVAVAAR